MTYLKHSHTPALRSAIPHQTHQRMSPSPVFGAFHSPVSFSDPGIHCSEKKRAFKPSIRHRAFDASAGPRRSLEEHPPRVFHRPDVRAPGMHAVKDRVHFQPSVTRTYANTPNCAILSSSFQATGECNIGQGPGGPVLAAIL